MKMKLWMFVMAMLVLGSASQARAQWAPYAMFSLGHYSGVGVGANTAGNQVGGMNALGGTFGLSDEPYHSGPIGFGFDARGIIENSANSTPYGNKMAGALIGPRLEINTLALPFRPYAQVELGIVGTNNGKQTNKDTHGAYQFQFGGDITIFPHVATRLEYGVGQLWTGNGTKHTLQTFGAGVVIRL
ncbi:hypothetical protein ACFQBQ_10510 [Granulicella cerasi]|uniref:Outer membrane protein beta-barrel domain-containing protein n=1 Tax=Granulicella cerasi TaxID=741063 RepID=A0ABW1Z963_9BACT|nr:hypothetical protein [Granulicella cerasi]